LNLFLHQAFSFLECLTYLLTLRSSSRLRRLAILHFLTMMQCWRENVFQWSL